jgi:hypothetical protein
MFSSINFFTGHVFLQQPCHPTFFALERLDSCMTRTYTQFTCPSLPLPIEVNSVCVAPCQGGWYRCQVVNFDPDTEMCDIKYLDYGGYHVVPAGELRQIRTDFLTLPFQAMECYLANISPNDEENLSAFVLEELVGGRVIQARMIGTNEVGVPMVHLYRPNNGQTTMVNRELVDRNCAQWLETTIVQLDSPLDHPSNYWNTLGDFQSRNLYPDPIHQVSHIYFFPSEECASPHPAWSEQYQDQSFIQEIPFSPDWQEQYRAPLVLPVLADFVPISLEESQRFYDQ